MEFNRIIKLLRKERGITQKQAAEDLGVSQALLSHYEKGIRECGLDFVVRVADYYNVSCDYLLGRSAERNGMMLSAEDLPNPDKMKDNIYKKLISNSLNVLYAKIGQCHSKALTTEVSAYLMMAVAKMFRLLYSAEPHNASSMFSIGAHRWRGYSDAVMRMSEANVEALLAGEDVNGGEGVKDPACLAMTTESLTREFPSYWGDIPVNCSPKLLHLCTKNGINRVEDSGKDNISTDQEEDNTYVEQDFPPCIPEVCRCFRCSGRLCQPAERLQDQWQQHHRQRREGGRHRQELERSGRAAVQRVPPDPGSRTARL